MQLRTLVQGLFLLFATNAMAQPSTQWSAFANTAWYNALDNTFQIHSAEELAGLSQLVAGGNAFAGKTILLANDLDLGANLWTPIGPDYTHPFSGTVNGNGHVVSNLYVQLPNADWVGLFGMTTGGTLANIRIAGAYIRGNGTVGALVGNASTNSTITDCHATGVDIVAGDFNVGGLAGSIMTSSDMLRCSATGSVSGVSQVGGLVGSPWDLTSISQSWSAGTVSGEYLVGGLVGFSTFAFAPNRFNTLNNCYSRANASATIGRAGGLYGGTQGALIISNCYATGTATGTELTGGFIGVSGGMAVTNSYWDTETSATTTGIAGWEGPQTPQEITGMGTAQLKTQDMVNLLNNGQANAPWTINPSINDGYPAFENTATGIAQVETGKAQVAVYPALFTGTVYISSQAELSHCTVYGTTGQRVHGARLSGNFAALDLGMVAPGLYYVQVGTAQGTITRRIVKQ